MTRLVRSLSAARASSLLTRIFGHLKGPFAFRLWDGTLVPVGAGPAAFTVVIHAPETFLRLIREPSPLTFAEAFVETALDIEGDLFAAMDVANAVEEIRLPLAERVRILATLWKP